MTIAMPSDADESFSALGTALGEAVIQTIGPGLMERELNARAREQYDLYAMIVPYRVHISPRPTTPPPPDREDASEAPSEDNQSTVSSPASEPGAQWLYSHGADPMGNGTTYSATVQSTNTVSFDFPYSGPQHATLTLRTHPRFGRDIILRLERGQFLCPSYDGCSVLVRFDEGTAQTYSGAGPSDNSTEILFIRNYSRFVAGMSRASRVRISAEVFQEGSPAFEFDVRGFDLARYKPLHY